jgi:cell division transport system permease protein
MTRLSFLIREALISLRRNVLVVAGAVVAVFISLTLAFGALIVNELLRVNTLAWQGGVHIVTFLWDEGSDGVPAGAHLALLAEVRSWPEVKDAKYWDKAQAWVEYQEIFASRPDYLEGIDPSVLPASIRIELNDINTYRDVLYRLAGQSQIVRSTSTYGEQLEQIAGLTRVARVFGLGLALVLGASAVVLIANTIQMAIYSRRDEISIMKLVGASNWYVRVPFILEGLIEGLVGAVGAVTAVWVVSRSLRTLGDTIRLFNFAIADRFFLRWGIVFLLFGAAAGVLGSMLGLSRYLRDDEGERPVGVRRALEPA